MNLSKLSLAACFIFILAFSNYSQINTGIDPTFIPEIVTQDFINDYHPVLTLQSDEKLLVYSRKIPTKVVRLNTDGSRDASFYCLACRDVADGSLAVQSDGKILLAGSDADSNQPKIIRLNADGSLDESFSVSLSPTAGFTASLIVYGVRADGKIYVGLKQYSQSSNNITIYRLNPNGTVDNFFTPIFNNWTNTLIAGVNLKVFPDGRVFLYGQDAAYGTLAQLNADGSKNTAFVSPILTYQPGIPTVPVIFDIDSHNDGKISIVGRFRTVNGSFYEGVARLNIDGSVDSQFLTPFGLFSNGTSERFVETVKALPDNRLLIGSRQTFRKIARLNANGSIDNTYIALNLWYKTFTADEAGRAYLLEPRSGIGIGLSKLKTDGSHDLEYNPNTSAVGSVTALALQQDGKIIVGGDFKLVNGVVRNTIARLNADGTTDASFNAGSGFTTGSGMNGEIIDIVVQQNGMIVVIGNFQSVNGVNRTKRVARLNSDGSVDAVFDMPQFSDIQSVLTVEAQTDGKFLIGGKFSASVNGVTYHSILRFNADGTIDPSFRVLSVVLGSIYDIKTQSDGKIMIGGEFTDINGVNRRNLARLNSNGTVDESFNANPSPSLVYQIIRQPDGKYLTRSYGISRYNENGSLDGNFTYIQPQQTYDWFHTMSLQPNGAIIVGGTFDFIGGQQRRNIARLLPNGRVDIYYEPKKANNIVRTSITQPDGKVIVGGDFTSIGDAPRFGIGRLTESSAFQLPPTRFDFDGDGRADISVFRPSNGTWYLNQPTNGFTGIAFGASSDKLVPGDYDGDGKTDIAVYRDGTWYLWRSQMGFTGIVFGTAEDIPVPGDYDGDGKTDLAVFRPSDGVWYLMQSSEGFRGVAFGLGTDKPVPADYDGDGKTDIAVNRNGTWYLLRSSLGFTGMAFGYGDDKLVPADYDGDGKADIAVFRPSNGTWYIMRSNLGLTGYAFGQGSDLPVPADYTGNGRADVAVYRPSNGTWYILNTTTSAFTGVAFGTGGDKPIPNAFVP